MAQAPAGSVLSNWAKDVIKKQDVQHGFCKYLEAKVGAKTFQDLAGIYKTDKWYKYIAGKDGKQLAASKEQFVMQDDEWNKFISEVEKAKKA